MRFLIHRPLKAKAPSLALGVVRVRVADVRQDPAMSDKLQIFARDVADLLRRHAGADGVGVEIVE